MAKLKPPVIVDASFGYDMTNKPLKLYYDISNLFWAKNTLQGLLSYFTNPGETLPSR